MRITVGRINIRMFLFLIFVMFIAYSRYQKSENVGDLMVAVEGSLILVALFLKRSEIRTVSYAFVIYVLSVISRLAQSYYLTRGIEGEAKVMVYRELGTALFLALIIANDSKEKFYLLLRNVGIFNAFAGCVEFFTRSCWFSRFITLANHQYMFQNAGTERWRVRTMFLHPLVCAVFTLVTWVILIYMPCRNKWIQILSQIAVIICLIGTKARSSWISLAVVCMMIFFVRQIKGKIELSREFIYRMGLAAVLIILLIVFFGDSIANLFEVVLNRLVSAMSIKDVGHYNRVTMFKFGLEEFNKAPMKNKLLGFGPDYAINMLKAHPIRGWNKAVDNTYVTLLLNYGLLGLLLHLTVLFYSIRNMFKTKSMISEMCAIGVISIFISAFFYEMYSWFTVTVCFSMLLLGQVDRQRELVREKKRAQWKVVSVHG